MKIRVLKIALFQMLLVFLALALYACGKDSDNEGNGGNGGNTSENTLVTPQYDKSSPIRNPLNGWVMYAARTAEPSYWDTEFYVPDIGKRVKALDYASACYIRTSWASLNPADGVYTWKDTNTQMGRLIQGALDRGLPVAFRIVVDGRDQGMNTPKFVFDAGAASYVENSSFPTRITPIPQDPVFKQYYTKFIEAFAKDFNDPERCAFIDGYGFGKWGEAHNVIYESIGENVSQNTERLKEEVFEWVTNLYTRCFDKVPVVINYHRLVGHPASWGSANENSSKLLTSAINKGYSIRQDAFGMTDYYQSWERQFATSWKHKRPIIMEGGWITGGTHRYWIDSSNKYREGHPEDVRQGEMDAAAEAHVNMMDFRAGYETETWFTLCFGLVQRFVTEGGYRLYPDQIYLPENLSMGDKIEISHRWKNMGWGYCPTNIPQWNQKFKVAFALLDQQNNVKKVFVDEQTDLSTWLKGTPTTYYFKTTLNGVTPGTYSWAVGIVDTDKENKIGIKIATKDNVLPSGWVKLLNVTVQ